MLFVKPLGKCTFALLLSLFLFSPFFSARAQRVEVRTKEKPLQMPVDPARLDGLPELRKDPRVELKNVNPRLAQALKSLFRSPIAKPSPPPDPNRARTTANQSPAAIQGVNRPSRLATFLGTLSSRRQPQPDKPSSPGSATELPKGTRADAASRPPWRERFRNWWRGNSPEGPPFPSSAEQRLAPQEGTVFLDQGWQSLDDLGIPKNSLRPGEKVAVVLSTNGRRKPQIVTVESAGRLVLQKEALRLSSLLLSPQNIKTRFAELYAVMEPIAQLLEQLSVPQELPPLALAFFRQLRAGSAQFWEAAEANNLKEAQRNFDSIRAQLASMDVVRTALKQMPPEDQPANPTILDALSELELLQNRFPAPSVEVPVEVWQ